LQYVLDARGQSKTAEDDKDFAETEVVKKVF